MLTRTNHGLIHAPRDPRDWHLGGVSGVVHEVLQADGQWTGCLPDKEQQNRNFETMACVSFSLLNAVEMQFRKRGIPANFSDRFLAKVSGTTPQGNSLAAVAWNASHIGLVSEVVWPWPPVRPMTWELYYATPSAEAFAEAANFLTKWKLSYEWVEATPEKMKEALKYSPLQVCNEYHAFTVVGYVEGERWLTFDTYGECDGSLPWDYRFVAAMAHYVTPINPNPVPMDKFTEGTMYQLVEGKGGFLLMAAGKLRLDDTAKILASWEVRNGGDTKGKVGVLKLSDLDGIQLYDLKGNPASL